MVVADMHGHGGAGGGVGPGVYAGHVGNAGLTCSDRYSDLLLFL